MGSSAAERKRRMDERRRSSGLVPLTVWVPRNVRNFQSTEASQHDITVNEVVTRKLSRSL